MKFSDRGAEPGGLFTLSSSLEASAATPGHAGLLNGKEDLQGALVHGNPKSWAHMQGHAHNQAHKAQGYISRGFISRLVHFELVSFLSRRIFGADAPQTSAPSWGGFAAPNPPMAALGLRLSRRNLSLRQQISPPFLF